jgi:hypothetical protein
LATKQRAAVACAAPSFDDACGTWQPTTEIRVALLLRDGIFEVESLAVVFMQLKTILWIG